MNTFLSTAQENQQAEYKSFVSQVVAPVVDMLQNQVIDLPQFLAQWAGSGYLSFCSPQECGGKSGGLLDAVLFAEALGRFDGGLGLTFGCHIACLEMLHRLSCEKLKADCSKSLAGGAAIGTLAVAEAAAGTDIASVQATIGGGKLSGCKTAVVSGDFAKHFLMLAKDEGQPTLLLLSAGDRAGFNCSNRRKLMGLHSAHVVDIQLQDVAVSHDGVIAFGQEAIDATVWAMCVAKLILSACALGMLDAAADTAVKHANLRQQFGAPIGSFQGIQWKLADMATDMAAARLQLYRAAWSHAYDRSNFLRHAAMAALQSTRAARQHCGEAIQILGLQGILEEQPLTKFYDDAKVMEIAAGTSELQKMVIAKQLHI